MASDLPVKKYPHQPLAYVPYDSAWPGLFETEKEKIQKRLGDLIVRVEHIGSTAVPGMSGKPIIDILIVINSESDTEKCLRGLEDLDYEYMDKPDQYYLRKSTGESTGFHIHMTTLDNRFWRERIAFRDYLRNHPEAVDEYIDVKQNLIKQFGNDKDMYREGKAGFISEITKKAL